MKSLDVYSIGEMVIDFIPGKEKDSYVRNAGGAPANVAIAIARNGLQAGFCGKVGDDDFGHFLIDKLKTNQVEVLCEKVTKDAVTTMAFVSLREDGERSFTFARKPGADMLLEGKNVRQSDIERSKIIHAGSCSLSKDPVAGATRRALKMACEMDKIVSFDVNYRDLMWEGDQQAAVKSIMEIMSCVDMLKISEEELEMVGGEEQLDELMDKNKITLIVKTMGKEGAVGYFKNQKIYANTKPVKAVDATGAGDAFWGGFLSSLLWQGVVKKEDINKEKIEKALLCGNVSGQICVQKKGAIDSLPTKQEIENYLEDMKHE